MIISRNALVALLNFIKPMIAGNSAKAADMYAKIFKGSGLARTYLYQNLNSNVLLKM